MQSSVKVPIEYSIKAIHIKVYSIIRTAKVELIMYGLTGAIVGSLLNANIPGGGIGIVIAGFIGSWIGTILFGAWGPEFVGFYFIPSLIGTILLIFVTFNRKKIITVSSVTLRTLRNLIRWISR